MVSPVVVKLSLPDLARTGNVVGGIYAFSTVGSILGTFATGFFFISWLGTRNLLFGMAILLFLAAPLFGAFFARRRRIVLFLVAAAFLWPVYQAAFDPVFDEETLYFKESNYYTIRLKGRPQKGREPLVTLYLDQLTHSCSNLENPSHLVYRYLRSFRELFEWRVKGRVSFSALFIGGGGYTFPRFLEAKFPAAEIDVVEIDPEVSEASRRFLGISPDSKIRTFNEDGRWFAMNRNGKARYDFIFKDVFNDLSIPYHLTTREFAEQMKALLKDDGILITNVIDRWEKGSFLPSYIRTLEEVFGRGNVHLISLGALQESRIAENRVVVTAPRGVDVDDLARSLNRISETERISHVVPQERLQDYLRQFQPVILTDDYAPVDNLTAPNFN
jgi:predicted membrane-bound spermidine synthase